MFVLRTLASVRFFCTQQVAGTDNEASLTVQTFHQFWTRYSSISVLKAGTALPSPWLPHSLSLSLNASLLRKSSIRIPAIPQEMIIYTMFRLCVKWSSFTHKENESISLKNVNDIRVFRYIVTPFTFLPTSILLIRLYVDSRDRKRKRGCADFFIFVL